MESFHNLFVCLQYEVYVSQKFKMLFPCSAPGGTLADDVTCTEFCLFKAQEDMETMQAYAQVNTLLNHCSLIAGKLSNIYLKSSPFRFRSLTN